MIVAVPVFNEEANLEQLLRTLVKEPGVVRIIVVDDGSTDGSLEIMRRVAGEYPSIEIYSTGGGSGQLEGWRIAARAAGDEVIAFIDGDALPGPGAVMQLAEAVRAGATIASGRVIPSGGTERSPYARFSADLIHRLRLCGHPKEAIIGRFFAVRAEWFVRTVDRSDVIANDAYLSCRAVREGGHSRYVPNAICYFAGATRVFDAAAQRQRADAGYAQLEAEGILLQGDGASATECLRILLVSVLWDPVGALAWIFGQVRGRFIQAYVTRSHAGTWQTQASTKRPLSR